MELQGSTPTDAYGQEFDFVTHGNVSSSGNIIKSTMMIESAMVVQEGLSEQGNDYRLSRWIGLSNATFFLGSSLYVWIAIWNLMDLSDDGTSVVAAGEVYEAADEDGTDWSDSHWTSYESLCASGALAYLANALVDFRLSVFKHGEQVGSGRFGDSPRREKLIALTFGLAATCDFVAVLIIDDEEPDPAFVAAAAAVYIYLLNAVLVLTGRIPSFSSWPKALTGAGDILFVIGSIIDVSINYFQNPRKSFSQWKLMAGWGLASALLWFVDSLLYIVADILPAPEESKEDDPLNYSLSIIEPMESMLT